VHIRIGQEFISWSSTLKYIGVCFHSASTVVVDVNVTVRKCHAVVNAFLISCYMSKLYLVELNPSCVSLELLSRWINRAEIANFIHYAQITARIFFNFGIN